METIRAFEGKDTVDLFELTGELADGDSKRVAAVFERVDPLANDLTFHFQGFGAPIVRKGKDYTAQQIDYVTKFHRFGNEHQPTSAPDYVAIERLGDGRDQKNSLRDGVR